MNTKEKIEIMQAYVDGKKIQSLDQDGIWYDIVKEPLWSWSTQKYRIKKEPIEVWAVEYQTNYQSYPDKRSALGACRDYNGKRVLKLREVIE